MDSRNPLRCWDGRYLVKAIVAAIVILAMSLLVKAFDIPDGTPLRYALAAVQVVAFTYSVVITVGAIRKLDELLQRIHLEAIAIAFALTGIVVVSWSLLSRAGLPPIEWGGETWLMMVLLWAGALYFRRRRYL